MERTEHDALIPYVLIELLDKHDGIIDVDASRVLDSIKSEKRRGFAVSIIADGILRIELLEEDELDEN